MKISPTLIKGLQVPGDGPRRRLQGFLASWAAAHPPLLEAVLGACLFRPGDAQAPPLVTAAMATGLSH